MLPPGRFCGQILLWLSLLVGLHVLPGSSLDPVHVGVLEAFLNSTNGAGWEHKLEGDLNSTACGWAPANTSIVIQCDPGLDKIVELRIPGNLLGGSIPTELGLLETLEILDLSTNQLSGNIPTELTTLASLTVLNLATNLLEGSIPDVSGLVSLETLNLGFNYLTENFPKSATTLTTLKEFSFKRNQVSGSLPTEIGLLTNLIHFDPSFNDLTGSIPTEMGALVKLILVDFEINDFSGTIPTELGLLTELTFLSVDGNEITGQIPTELGNLVKMEYLSIYDTFNDGTIPSELGNMGNLLWLYIDSTLTHGTIPTELGQFPLLEQFYVDTNMLTGTLPTEIGNMPLLTDLDFDSNLLTGTVPTEYGQLSNLLIFMVYGNEGLEGTIPTELGMLTNLTQLYFEFCSFVGTIPTEIGLMTSLYIMQMSNNKLSGTIPTELSGLESVHQMYLNANQLTGTVPDSLTDLPGLGFLYLASNKLSCPIKDYSSWSEANDFDLSSLECSTSCPAETYMNAMWPETQEFDTQGTCVANYIGSPSRACDRNVIQRVWNSEVKDPCRPLTILEQFQYNGWLILIAAVPAFVLLATSTSVLLVPQVRRLPHAISLLHMLAVPVKWISLAVDLYFLFTIYTQTGVVFAVSLGFLSFSFVSNLLSLVFLIFQVNSTIPEYTRNNIARMSLAGFLSLAGISNFRAAFFTTNPSNISPIFQKGSAIKTFLESFSMTFVFFKHVPLAVLQLYCFSLSSVPFSVPIAVILNLTCVVFGVTMELCRWIIAEKVEQVVVLGNRVFNIRESIASFEISSISDSLKRAPRKESDKAEKEKADASGKAGQSAEPPRESIEIVEITSTTSEVREWQTVNRNKLLDLLTEDKQAEEPRDPLDDWKPSPGNPAEEVVVGKDTSPAPYLKFFLYPLVLAIFPLVPLTFVIHFATGFGIPFALASLHRFAYIWKADRTRAEVSKRPDDWLLTWYQARGTFLLPINLLGQILVLMLFFTVVTVMGIVVFLIHLFGLALCFHPSFFPNLDRSFKQSYDLVLSHLFWVYFPFFRDPPGVRDTLGVKKNGHTVAETVLSYFYFLTAELAIPVADLTTDFIFSFALLERYNDPLQGERNILFAWMIVAFISTSLGCASDIFRVSVLFTKLSHKGFKISSVTELVHETSALFTPVVRDVPPKHRMAKFFTSLAEDAVQIAVSCSTISYIDLVSPLWGVQLAMSVLSAGFHISRFAVHFIYGKGFVKWVEYFVNVWLFTLIVGALSLIAGFTTTNRYCTLDKTLSETQQVLQVCRCDTVQFYMNVTGVNDLTEVHMIAQTTEETFFMENAALTTLSFGLLANISGPFEVVNNPSLSVLSFPFLTKVLPKGELEIAHNPGLPTLAFPLLEDVSGSMRLHDLGASLIDLSSISSFGPGGHLTVHSNPMMRQLLLSTVGDHEGVIEVYNNPLLTSMSFLTIQRAYGEIHIRNNTATTQVNFPSLLWSKGRIVVEDNPHLLKVNFPVVDTIEESITIRKNPQLDEIVMDSVLWLGYPPNRANVTFAENDSLTRISFELMYYIADQSYLYITDNPVLELVELPGLEYLYTAWIRFSNNPLLTTVVFLDGVYNPLTNVFVASE